MGKVVVSGSGQVCSDKDAADCLAQGHPKSSGNVATKWGMKDQNADGQKLTGRGKGGDCSM